LVLTAGVAEGEEQEGRKRALRLRDRLRCQGRRTRNLILLVGIHLERDTLYYGCSTLRQRMLELSAEHPQFNSWLTEPKRLDSAFETEEENEHV
jgi:hypothetical protein